MDSSTIKFVSLLEVYQATEISIIMKNILLPVDDTSAHEHKA